MRSIRVLMMAALLTPASYADTSAKALDPATATATAPAVYKVKFATTKGDFTVEVHRD